MADEEPVVMSVKDRIARLQIDQVGRSPTPPTAPPKPIRFGRPLASPPTPPTQPPRPQAPSRPADVSSRSNTPLAKSPPPAYVGGNPSPAYAFGMDGTSRPALPPRNSTQSSLSSAPSPPLPPRHSPLASPALPPRRPSATLSQPESTVSRRLSSESISSIATTQSSISACSLAAPPGSTGTGTRYTMRAPSFDAASLPALPARRTETQKDAYYRSGSKQFNRRAPKSIKSSPNVPTITSSRYPMESVQDADLSDCQTVVATARPDLATLQSSKPRNWG